MNLNKLLVATGLIATTAFATPIATFANTETTTETEYEDWEDMTNAEYVATLSGLTDDEKTELANAYDTLDAETLDESSDEFKTLINRVTELENKAFLADIQSEVSETTALTDEEKQELINAYQSLMTLESSDDYDEDSTEVTTLENRIEELEDKIYAQELEEYVNSLEGLTDDEKKKLLKAYKKLDSLYEKVDEQEEKIEKAEKKIAKLESKATNIE